MGGLHHVAVLLQTQGPKGLCCELESHQGATPEQGAADLGSNHKNTGREGGAQCHILGQSVPVSSVSSDAEEVSLVKVKAGELQTLVQACLIVGQETNKLKAAFSRFHCQRRPPVCADSITSFSHSLLLQRTQKGSLHPAPLHLLCVLWDSWSLLCMVFVVMNTKLRNLCFLQHPHLLLKPRFFCTWEQRGCC